MYDPDLYVAIPAEVDLVLRVDRRHRRARSESRQRDGVEKELEEVLDALEDPYDPEGHLGVVALLILRCALAT